MSGERQPQICGCLSRLQLTVGVERDDVVHRLVCRRHELLDVACSLADAVFVLDECQTNVVVALFAEADARGNGNVSLLDQKLGKLQRSEMTELFRNLRPGKHGGCWRRHVESRLAE